MNGISEITERYIALYRENIDKITAISSPYINSFREAAFEKFRNLEFRQKRMRHISIQI